MFIHLPALFPVAVLAAVVAAVPAALDVRGSSSSSECSTGPNNCCNSVQSSSSTIVAELAQVLGVNLAGVTNQPVGLGCTSIGGTDSTCTQQPVCCNGDSFSGLIVIGCSPINIL